MANPTPKKESKRKTKKDEPSFSPAKIKELPIWSVIAIFATLTIIFFWGQISGSTFFWDDFTEFVYPMQSFAAVESASGIMPFWNPFSYSGMPFYADLQVGFFYPFNRLLTLFVTSDGRLPVWIIQFIVIFHYFIALFSMFWLCRKWGASSIASIIGAVSYSFSLIIVCHTIHPMIVYHLAWFPLVIMFFYKAIDELNIRAAIISGLIFGMSLLSGHPQLTLYEAFFLLLLFLWIFVAKLRNKELPGNKILSYLVSGALPIIIAVGIFSIQFLPSQELAGLSKRAEMSYEEASEGSLEFKQLTTAIVPKMFGWVRGTGGDDLPFHLTITDTASGAQKNATYYYFWESAFYFGILALILGIFGLWSNIKDRKIAFMLFVSIFGLLFALGSNFFIFPIFYNLPFFGSFRNPGRMMLFMVIAFGFASAVGFDTLWKGIRDKKLMVKLIVTAGSILFISILAYSGVFSSIFETPDKFVSDVNNQGGIALLFALLFTLIIFLIFIKKLKPLIGGSILILLMFTDIIIAGIDFNNGKYNPEDYYKIDTQISQLFRATNPDNIFRVNTRIYQPPYMAMQRNQGLISRIMQIEGYNPLILKRVMPPLNSRDTIHSLYNVKYELAIDESNQPRFVEKKDRLSTAWIVYNPIYTDEENIESTMRNGGYDYSKYVVLEEKTQKEYKRSDDISGTIPIPSVECNEYGSNYSKFQIDNPREGIMVFSEIWYPAWKVYINGKETKILKANYCFRAVEVPAGKHIVEMKYESATFNAGLYISLITLIASVIALFFVKPRN